MTLSTALSQEQPRQSPRRPTRTPFTLADVLGALAIFSVVAVVALWMVNQGGLQMMFTNVYGVLGSLALLTGLLASDLLVLVVVLLARTPWVERAWDVTCSPDGTAGSVPPRSG